ncbi:hypothetical protein [Streptomyces sp. NPDC018352]|uniref:hypothetical protein n=1 Tax=Streptomyces sp. NPDC018352 TaxID=3157194 RepID=UPI0033D688F5
MSIRLKPSSVDDRLHQTFGAPVDDLYEAATSPDASPPLRRALEMRSFLALAEEQVAVVLEHVHAMTAQYLTDEPSPDELRIEAQWLEAALDARDGYRSALGELLRAMPPPDQRARPERTTQLRATAALPPSAAPAPQRAGATRTRRP